MRRHTLLQTSSPLVQDIRTIPDRIRLIDAKRNTNEIVLREDARRLMEADDLDLIFVSAPPNAPPVYKLVDYNKFLFEKNKEEKVKRKTQRAAERTPKEMQFRQNINVHDYTTKLNHIREWLPRHDVYIEIRMDRKTRATLPRGVDIRQLIFWKDFVLNRVQRDLADMAKFERPMIGERLIKIMVRPL